MFNKNILIVGAVLAWIFLPKTACAQVTVDVRGETRSLEHFWSYGVGAGRVGEALRAGWQEQLDLAMEHCGYKYIRMHALFNDDMFIYKRRQGKDLYNFQYLDEVYDRLIDKGIRPFVELSFFPRDIAAKNSKTQFWYKAYFTPDPLRFGRWAELVKATVSHLVERYGIEEVSQWYFEVWNEPDLTDGFFDGTRDEYFQLYKCTAEAVKSVDARLRVGGPATSNFVADARHDGPVQDYALSKTFGPEEVNKQQWKAPWIKEFLEFCHSGDIPLDFLSSHPYPMDASLDPEHGDYVRTYRYIHATRDDVRYLRETVDASPYKGMDIFVSEWNVSSKGREILHDVLAPGASVIKIFLESTGYIQGLFWWTFTDIFEEGGAGLEIFHGGFGQINFQGIVKPVFHAFRMLNALGDLCLYNEDPVVVTRDSRSGDVAVLSYNYPDEYIDRMPTGDDIPTYMQASGKTVDLVLTGLGRGERFELELVDDSHGNAYKVWQEMGAPHSPSRAQIQQLKEAAWDTVHETLKADKKGRLHIKRELSPWSFFLVRQVH